MPLLWPRWIKFLMVFWSVLCLPMQTQAADYFTRHQAYAALDCQQLQRNGSSGNCIDHLLELANLELNQRYDQLMSRYQLPNANPKNQNTAMDQQLLKAQYQWLQFRNQHCVFEAAATQSNQQANQQMSNQIKLCQLALTRERIDYLSWFLGR